MEKEREKNLKTLRHFVLAALIVAISGIAIIETIPTASAFSDPGLVAEGRGCVVYQTYPAQVSCSLPIGPSTLTMV
jgi:hypothetical protein